MTRDEFEEEMRNAMAQSNAGSGNGSDMAINEFQQQYENAQNQINQQNMANGITATSGFYPTSSPIVQGLSNFSAYNFSPGMDAKLKVIFDKDPVYCRGIIVGMVGMNYQGEIKGIRETQNGFEHAIFIIDMGLQIVEVTHEHFTILDVPGKPLSPREYKKKILTELVNGFNGSRQNAIDSRIAAIGSIQNDIVAYAKTIKNKKIQLRKAQLLAEEKLEPYTVASLTHELAKLAKHPYLTDAYISREGHAVFITKDLRRDTGKKFLPGGMGRFLITVSLVPGSRWIKIRNMDWRHASYDHANIEDGGVCWGDNATEVEAMLQTVKLFELVEFCIMFLTCYPQDSGSNPYVNFDDWFDNKSKIEDVIPEEKL